MSQEMEKIRSPLFTFGGPIEYEIRGTRLAQMVARLEELQKQFPLLFQSRNLKDTEV